MILTVTPNPSLDLLFTADRLVWDDANRVPMPRRRPGGQGINVVRAARVLDPTASLRAIAALGGSTGRELEALLAAEGTPLRAVWTPGETRIFVGVRERAAGRALLLNPRGPEAGPDVAGTLIDAVIEELDRHDDPVGRAAPRWLACCGSLIPGLPPDFHARAGAAARDRGWRFVPDCDGEALRLAASAGADLLVPNLHEAERLLGRAIVGTDEAGRAARALLELGPRIAAITLGERGAVLAAEGGCWWARLDPRPRGAAPLAQELSAGSEVGAGDAFLAALLLELGSGARPPEAAAAAVAAGTATLLSRDAALLDRRDLDRVREVVTVDEIPG